MEVGLQYQLLIVILLVCFVTYFITRNYFNFLLKMQNSYIDNLRKEFNELEKTHKELHRDFSITIGDLNTSIENLRILFYELKILYRRHKWHLKRILGKPLLY